MTTRCWRRWGRWAALSIAPAGAVYMSILLAVGGPAAREPERRDQVACYEQPDIDANATVLSRPEIAQPGGAVAACRAEWPAAYGRPAPNNLATCVHPGGGQAVFPGQASWSSGETCEHAGAYPIAVEPTSP